MKAPLVGLSGDGVSEVVVRACRQARIAPVRAHRLRHTIATELLRRGAGLPEIGQVLRHAEYRRDGGICQGRPAGVVAAGATVAREPVMSALSEAVGDYLALRRALGYKLEAHGRVLPQFVEFLEQRQATVITTALALQWATEPADASVVWWHQRLAIARGFARYLQASNFRHEVPPVTCDQPSSAAPSRTWIPKPRSRR